MRRWWIQAVHDEIINLTNIILLNLRGWRHPKKYVNRISNETEHKITRCAIVVWKFQIEKDAIFPNKDKQDNSNEIQMEDCPE